MDSAPITWYVKAGSASAPVIVLLHGSAWTKAAWLPHIAALQDDFDVIAIDLPGHGALAGQPFTITGAARRVRAVIESTSRRRAVVVGHSLGGYVAMRVAQIAPDCTSGLVLAGSSVAYTGPLAGIAMLNSVLLRLYSPRWLTRLQEKSVRGMLDPVHAESNIAAGFYWYAAAQGFVSVAGCDPVQMLRSYRHPILILNGADDAINRQGEDRLCSACPAGILSPPLRGCGHLAPLEQPSEWVDRVRQFALPLEN